jgi:hypothetical protein
MASASRAVPNRHTYIRRQPSFHKATRLSIDDVRESEEEDKAIGQARKKLAEPDDGSREEAISEDTEAEIGEDSDDDTEELEGQESEELS